MNYNEQLPYVYISFMVYFLGTVFVIFSNFNWVLGLSSVFYIHFFLFLFFYFDFFHHSWFTMFCQFFTIYQVDSATHTCVYSFLSYYHAPSQVTRHISQCYTAVSHCLSITDNSLQLSTQNSQHIPLPPPPPWKPQVCSPCQWFSSQWKGSFVPYIRFQI